MRLLRLDLALAILRVALIAAILPLAIGWRTPLLASWRTVALVGLLALPLLLVAIEIWTLRRAQTRAVRLTSGAALVLALLAFGATATLEASFQYQRRAVLAADPAELERLGRHFLIGYRRAADLQALLERRAVAGVFISALNVEGRSRDEVRHRIDALQALRREQDLSPLWIATDQEGGPVSRVSPPLMRRPALAEIVALHRDRGRADGRDPSLRGAPGPRSCGPRREPQFRAGGRSQPRRGQSGRPPLAHLIARDLDRSGGGH